MRMTSKARRRPTRIPWVRATEASKSASNKRSLKRHERKQRDHADQIAGQKVSVGDTENVSEEEVLETNFDASILNESDAKGKGEDIKRGHGGFILNARAAGDHMPAKRHKNRCEKPPEQQAARIQANQHRRQSESWQHGMGERVRHEREASQDDVRSKKAIRKADQHACQQCPAHELVFERLCDPVHRLRPAEDPGRKRPIDVLAE